MIGSMTLEGFRPGALMNMNDRPHWRAKAELTKEWKNAAFWIAKQNRCQPLAHFPVTVTCIFDRKSTGRIDPHNYYPTVKALMDGLTMAGLWPDDDSTHVKTLEPVFIKGEGRRFRITITWEVPDVGS